MTQCVGQAAGGAGRAYERSKMKEEYAQWAKTGGYIKHILKGPNSKVVGIL